MEFNSAALLTQCGCYVGTKCCCYVGAKWGAKSMENMVPILVQHGSCIGAVYVKYSSNISTVLAASLSRILCVFLVLKSNVLVVVVFCVRD